MRFVTGFVIAACFAAPAFAQEAENTKLAKDLLVAMRAADTFDAVVPSVLTALKPTLTANNPKAAKDWDDIAPLMVAQFSASKNQLLDDIAPVYARTFTADELRAFVNFYKTPAGEKLARLTPALSQEVMTVGQRYGQQVAAQLVERMRDELRKRGNKI